MKDQFHLQKQINEINAGNSSYQQVRQEQEIVISVETNSIYYPLMRTKVAWKLGKEEIILLFLNKNVYLFLYARMFSRMYVCVPCASLVPVEVWRESQITRPAATSKPEPLLCWCCRTETRFSERRAGAYITESSLKIRRNIVFPWLSLDFCTIYSD